MITAANCLSTFPCHDGEICAENAISKSSSLVDFIQMIVECSIWCCPEIRAAVCEDNKFRYRCLGENNGCWYPFHQRPDVMPSGSQHCTRCAQPIIQDPKGNIKALVGFRTAIGIPQSMYTRYQNWNVCHIVDQSKAPCAYELHTELANLVMLPSAFHEFTHMKKIQPYFIYRSYELYKPYSITGRAPLSPAGYNSIVWPKPICLAPIAVKTSIVRRSI